MKPEVCKGSTGLHCGLRGVLAAKVLLYTNKLDILKIKAIQFLNQGFVQL